MKNRRILIFCGTTLVVVAITALPSMGSNSLLSSFLDPLRSRVEQLQSQLMTSLEGQISNISSALFGALGLPDLTSAENAIKNTHSNEGDYVLIDEATNEIVRETTKAKADGTLSEQGQQAVQEKLQAIEQTTQTLEEQAQTAQNETVTQNVLKQIALQNAQQGSLLGTLNSEITDLSVKQDLANRNLTNISQAIDSQNLAQQADLDGAGNRVLHLSSMFRMF